MKKPFIGLLLFLLVVLGIGYCVSLRLPAGVADSDCKSIQDELVKAEKEIRDIVPKQDNLSELSTILTSLSDIEKRFGVLQTNDPLFQQKILGLAADISTAKTLLAKSYFGELTIRNNSGSAMLAISNYLENAQVDLNKLVESGDSFHIRRTIDGTTQLLSSWPFLALLVLIFCFIEVDLIKAIFRSMKSIRILGTEVELSEQKAELVASEVHNVLEQYRQQINERVNRLTEAKMLRTRLQSVFQNKITTLIGEKAAGVRCTIHVSDVLFTDSIYQLVNYYPKGGGSGRAWDIGFGIIGKAWRLRETEIQGHIPTDRKVLIREWGMTPEEADSAGCGRKSFAAIIIRSQQNIPVGLLYMDHSDEYVFGELGTNAHNTLAQNIIDAVKEASGTCGISNAVEEIMNEVAMVGPHLKIYG